MEFRSEAASAFSEGIAMVSGDSRQEKHAKLAPASPVVVSPEPGTVQVAPSLQILFQGEENSSLGYTHFISLPLALHPVLKEQAPSSKEKKRKDATSKMIILPPDPEYLEKIKELTIIFFIETTKLHLTVLMLELRNKDSVATACDILQDVKPKVWETLNHQPISIRLKDLGFMKGNLWKAHVLHACVEEGAQKNRLMKSCNIIRNAYMKAGLVSQKERNHELKLHVTLMNTSQRMWKRGKRFGQRIPFDATEIISQHGSRDWGEHMIMEAHLSERFVYDRDGYYHCCGSIQFPFTPTEAFPL